MPTVKMIEYKEANPAVRHVYDDIMATRQVDWINNFWKTLAVQPELLKRTWEGVKSVMAEGALDLLTKEMIYIAVSVANGCTYCIHSHTAAAKAKGMTPEQHGELVSVIGMAMQTNGLVQGLGVEIDDVFKA